MTSEVCTIACSTPAPSSARPVGSRSGSTATAPTRRTSSGDRGALHRGYQVRLDRTRDARRHGDRARVRLLGTIVDADNGGPARTSRFARLDTRAHAASGARANHDDDAADASPVSLSPSPWPTQPTPSPTSPSPTTAPPTPAPSGAPGRTNGGTTQSTCLSPQLLNNGGAYSVPLPVPSASRALALAHDVRASTRPRGHPLRQPDQPPRRRSRR